MRRPIIPKNHVLLDVFNETVTPLFQNWIANHKQSQTITEIRDTLLPRLISGQLRIPEAETLIEETTV
jgi:type I restriction enzyme S subunit